MDRRHRPSRNNPWLSLLLVAIVVLLLSCAVLQGATADGSTGTGTDVAQQLDSGNGGDCHGHGHRHNHSHGHHGCGGGGGSGKDKPGTPTTTSSYNPWALSAGAAPRPQVVSGFTATTGVIVLITGAAVCWSLITTY